MLFIIIIYSIPLIRAAAYFIVNKRFANERLPELLGKLFWSIHLVRDSIGILFWIIASLLYRDWFGFPVWLWGAFAITISICERWNEKNIQAKFINWLCDYPSMNPNEAMRAYFSMYGPWKLQLSAPEKTICAPIIDFKRGSAPQLLMWPIVIGAWTTLFFASLVVLASRHKSLIDRRAFSVDVCCRMWGARLASLVRMRISLEGSEHLENLDAPVIITPNHQSFVDGVLGAAFGLVNMNKRGPLQIRYMVAKDHFLDNPFLHYILKLGLAAKASGMVFVNRKGTYEQRQQAIIDAAQQMIVNKVDVAMFPHGTRVPLRYSEKGERLEPGYFVAGGRERMAKIGSHLKTGAARLAPLAANKSAKGYIYVVPVGLSGAGIVYPKGAMYAQTETDVTIKVGRPIKVFPNTDSKNLHELIDAQLRELLLIEERLTEKLPQELAISIKEWAEAKRIIWPFLDGLQQLPESNREALINDFKLVLAKKDLESLSTLYNKMLGYQTK